MKLTNLNTHETLIPDLEVANTFASRSRGLLGRDALALDQALWIWDCRWVHTFGMRFPIDLIYVNRKLEVKKTVSRMKPGRLGWPVFSAWSVIELRAGFLEQFPVNLGDKLHVDHSVP